MLSAVGECRPVSFLHVSASRGCRVLPPGAGSPRPRRAWSEIKRRSRVAGTFPNSAAVIRLGGAILIDMHDEWIAGDCRFLSEGSMAKLYDTSDTGDLAVIECAE